MRIAWRWVLPVVPMALLAFGGFAEYKRDQAQIREWKQVVPSKYKLSCHRFSCMKLWTSRAAREEYFADDFNEDGCAVSWPSRIAATVNLPSTIAAYGLSALTLELFDWPMRPSSYILCFALSFAFWCAVGAWFGAVAGRVRSPARKCRVTAGQIIRSPRGTTRRLQSSAVTHNYVQVRVHVIFSTKERRRLIPIDVQPRLWQYIAGICRNLEVKPLAVGGFDDHCHLLISLPATLTLAAALQEIKANSSRWMNSEVVKEGLPMAGELQRIQRVCLKR
jgi:REP element-mobilizing transposase RayT